MNMKEALLKAKEHLINMPKEEFEAMISKYTKEDCAQYAEIEREVWYQGRVVQLEEELLRILYMLKERLHCGPHDEEFAQAVKRIKSITLVDKEMTNENK
jgi:hypothetical protein